MDMTPPARAYGALLCIFPNRGHTSMSFFATGESPKILHFVIPIQKGVKLSQQPPQLLPDIWKDYLVNTSEESLLPVTADSNNCNSKVKSSTSKITDRKIIPDFLKNILSYENGKWYSKTNPQSAVETSALKPTIASTKLETTEGNPNKGILESSSSKIQKCSTLDKPTKVLSLAKPHNTVINKYRKKSVKTDRSDKINHKLNGQHPTKKKKIVIDKSAPPKVKFVLKSGNVYPSKIIAEHKSDTVVEEKKSICSLQHPFKNEVTKETEPTDFRKNGLIQTSVKKTKDVIPKKSVVSVKNKTLSCNGYDEKETLSGIKLIEESRAFLANFNLIPKESDSCGSALANQVHNHNSLDKVAASVEKRSVSDFARTCKFINGVKQSVCVDDLAKPGLSQSVPSTKLRLRSREVPHRRRPPSTVKLKENEELT
ncbi:hypothetical protein J6590_022809 [Homalodisca vitripennis]|nr:hypothetical protein J6590_022809 [Homalodisca vitripennis]